jgi:hypothetical protein
LLDLFTVWVYNWLSTVEKELKMSNETKMYGMTEAEIRRQYMESITAKMSGMEMVVMGILSDCQELSSWSNSNESVRQQLNVAKFILCEMMDSKESV